MSRDPLLQPYQWRHLTLKNRIITTSHEPSYTDDGMPKERYRAYHAERARAGVAMVMTAGSASVSRNSPPAFGNVLAWKDEVVPWMGALADECHGHGAAVMIQLSHLGRRTRWDRGDWLPVLSPGPEREPAHRHQPKVIEEDEIAGVIADFADAAERMKAAGLDGVEILCHGHLIDQFLSPLTNAMPDPWGGSLENRARFATEVLRAVRARVGPNFLISARMDGDESAKGGFMPDEAVIVCRGWRDEGLIDAINVNRGRIHTDAAMTQLIPIHGMPSAPHLDLAALLRREVGLTTLQAARIPDLATARHAITSGSLDLVGMTRAHMADPEIVRKLVSGEEDRIRPCVGATFCLDRIYLGDRALCVHNPSTGRERELPHAIEPAPVARRVVVVGAGPGGLEAAMVAAQRGHRVTLFEAASEAGGQVRLLAQDPRRRELLGITEWRVAECGRLGVEMRFDTWAEEGDVLALDPDEVVIATGGLATDGGFPGVVTSWDILSGDVKPAARILLWDDAGDHAGLQAAEKAARAGSQVEIVTADRAFAPEVMGMNLAPYIRALQPLGARLTVAERLLSVAREGNAMVATLGTDYSDHTTTREVDQVVVNAGTTPIDDLFHALRPRSGNRGLLDTEALLALRPQPTAPGFRLWRIGDAVEARNIHAAILDANRLLRAI